MKIVHPIDVHAGNRLRLRRIMRGMSQGALGEHVGLTFQQIQKYETGANRMAASRLHEFAGVLEVPVSYFFDELGGTVADDTMAKRETIEMVRAYYRIQDPRVRLRLREMIRAMGHRETGR